MMSCSHSLHTPPPPLYMFTYWLQLFNPHVPQVFFPCSHVHVRCESQPLQINTDQLGNRLTRLQTVTPPLSRTTNLCCLCSTHLCFPHNPGAIKASGSLNSCDSHGFVSAHGLLVEATIWWGSVEIAAVLTHRGSVVTELVYILFASADL